MDCTTYVDKDILQDSPGSLPGSWDVTRKPPQGQDFSTISVPTILKQRHRLVSIRRFITRRLPPKTVPLTLIWRTENWTQFSHICSLWDLFHATEKPGSLALPTKPVPSRKAVISPLLWPDGTGSSSIRPDQIFSDRNTKKQGCHFWQTLFFGFTFLWSLISYQFPILQ